MNVFIAELFRLFLSFKRFCDHSGLYFKVDSIKMGRQVGDEMQERSGRTVIELGTTALRALTSLCGASALTTAPHKTHFSVICKKKFFFFINIDFCLYFGQYELFL